MQFVSHKPVARLQGRPTHPDPNGVHWAWTFPENTVQMTLLSQEPTIISIMATTETVISTSNARSLHSFAEMMSFFILKLPLSRETPWGYSCSPWPDCPISWSRAKGHGSSEIYSGLVDFPEKLKLVDFQRNSKSGSRFSRRCHTFGPFLSRFSRVPNLHW